MAIALTAGKIFSNGVEYSASDLNTAFSGATVSLAAVVQAYVVSMSSGDIFDITNSGTGDSIEINSSSTGICIDVNKTGTGAGTCVDIANAGTGIGLLISQSGNGNGLEIDNAGTSFGMYIEQNGVLATNYHAFHVYSNAAQTNEQLVRFAQDNASSDKHVLEINDDGTGGCLFLDHNNSGIAQIIDLDANSASDCVGIQIAIQSGAGAGKEYAFEFGGDEVAGAMSTDDNTSIRVKTAAGERYIKLYTA